MEEEQPDAITTVHSDLGLRIFLCRQQKSQQTAEERGGYQP